MALAGRPEGRARDDRDMLLGQELLGERVGREAGRARYLRKRVERAAWLERPKPDLVQSIDDEAAPAIVLGDHPFDVGFGAAKRLERRVLRRGRRRHDPV